MKETRDSPPILYNARKQQKTSAQTDALPSSCSNSAQQSSSTGQDTSALLRGGNREEKSPLRRSFKLSASSVRDCKIALPFLHVTGNLRDSFVQKLVCIKAIIEIAL